MADIAGKRAPRRRRGKAEAAPTTPDPLEIAMEAEASGETPSGIAHEVLRKQSALVGWQIASERAAFALRLLTILVGILALAGLAAMAWTAAHDTTLVVRPFSAPPSWTARGLGGDVLAGRYLDELSRLNREANKGFLVAGAVRSTGDDIRLEIPQTGVSLSEVQQLMTRWLGHQTLVSGALSEGADGEITLTVRVEGQGAFTSTGQPSELDAMLRESAERSLAAANPIRAQLALQNMGRWDDALRLATEHLASLTPDSPDWPLALVFRTFAEPDFHTQIAFLRKALALQPELMTAWVRLGSAENSLQHEQAVFDAASAGLAVRDADQPAAYSARGLRLLRADLGLWLAQTTGDFSAGARLPDLTPANRVRLAAQAHEGQTALSIVAELELTGHIPPDTAALLRARIARAAGDWPAMARAMETYRAAHAARMEQPAAPGQPPRREVTFLAQTDAVAQARAVAAMHAITLARSGRIDEARSVAEAMPLDCTSCLRARAEIETAARNRPGADAWYARALAATPRLPLAEGEWAASRLELGDPAGAAEKAAAAVAKGPRYADPLETWGEALMAQGDARGAAAKFAEAAKLAPNWGRLHLKWGEALAKQGKTEDARAKWRAATAMDLTAAERAELARLSP